MGFFCFWGISNVNFEPGIDEFARSTPEKLGQREPQEYFLTLFINNAKSTMFQILLVAYAEEIWWPQSNRKTMVSVMEILFWVGIIW
jgi:hypothetical protein